MYFKTMEHMLELWTYLSPPQHPPPQEGQRDY